MHTQLGRHCFADVRPSAVVGAACRDLDCAVLLTERGQQAPTLVGAVTSQSFELQ